MRNLDEVMDRLENASPARGDEILASLEPREKALVLALRGQAAKPRAAPHISALPASTMIAERYVIVEKVGEGGMGVVYKSFDIKLARDTAIKFLLRPQAEASRDALAREAQVLGSVQHPNVVPVHDIEEFGGHLFFVMDHVDGSSLDALIERRLARREVLSILQACARGLAAVHAAGLVHLDFKPSNVMVSGSGNVLLMDFGLARIAQAGQDPERVAGTPLYMAPEQHGSRQVGQRADIYSFCAVLYEAFAGVPAFGWRAPPDLLEEKRALQLPRLGNRNVPSWLLPIVRRGLAFEPERRFETMDDLVQALDLAPRRRRRALVIVAGLAVTVAGVGGLYLGPSMPPDRHSGFELEPLHLAGDRAWSGPDIEVCWETAGDENQKRWARDALGRSWEATTGLTFTGWRRCNAGSGGIRVALSRTEPPHTKAVGAALAGVPEGVVLNFDRESGFKGSQGFGLVCARSMVVHQFAHAVGFTHGTDAEEHRHFEPDQVHWKFYCTNRLDALSDALVEQARALYGPPSAVVPTYLVGDVDGDGAEELVQASRQAPSLRTCRHRAGRWSCSGAPAELHDWSSVRQGFIIGDFDGDERSDVAQVYQRWHSIPRCLSRNGGWSCKNAPAEIWDWDSSEQGFLRGDFDGDGRTDIAQTYRQWDTIPVCLATDGGWSCSNRRANIEDSGSRDQRFLAGDFNGDGRTDVALLYGKWSKIPVCFAEQGWSCVTRPADVLDGVFAAGDVNADGRAEVIQVQHDFGRIATCAYLDDQWRCVQTPTSLKHSGEILTGDFDGDGRVDIAQAHSDLPTVQLCLARDDVGWDCTGPRPRLGGSGSPIVADLDGDARSDLARVRPQATQFPVCLSAESGWRCSE